MISQNIEKTSVLMRPFLREPITDIFEAANDLADAVTCHLNGDKATAAKLVARADRSVIADWTDSIWGKYDPAIHNYITIADGPPNLKAADCTHPRMPNAEGRQAILARDGYHCRFCGIPVIHPKIRDRFRKYYPDEARWGKKNGEEHAALECMWLQFDHVLPYTRGGLSTLDNVIITCAPCNFGRMSFTLAEARLLDPLEREISRSWSGYNSWDGLQNFR
jgi:hypothetical protein